MSMEKPRGYGLGRRAASALASALLGSTLLGATACGSSDDAGDVDMLPTEPSVPAAVPAAAMPPGPAAPAPAAPTGTAAPDGESTGNVINGTGMSASTEGAAPEPSAPPAAPEEPAPVAEGDGFFSDSQCFPRCLSDETDVDEAGVSDGFGFESGASCIVPGSAPALAAEPCVPELTEPVQPPDVPPGDGFLLGDTCFAPCIVDANIDDQGFGYEQERSCILPGSPASTRGIACIPPPPEVLGICPSPLVCPVVNGITLPCGCYTERGFAERKQEIADAGGDRRFLASAMLETSTLTTDYPLGDVFPGPDNQVGTGDDVQKTGGAANFGITKMNWTMIRQCHPAYRGLNDNDYRRGIELNDSLSLDIQVYNECRDFFGDRWFGGHRNGTPGLNNPNTPDIRAFQGAVEWIFQMLPGHEVDDIKFYVSVQAI